MATSLDTADIYGLLSLWHLLSTPQLPSTEQGVGQFNSLLTTFKLLKKYLCLKLYILKQHQLYFIFVSECEVASGHPWLSITLVLTLGHVSRVSVLDIIVRTVYRDNTQSWDDDDSPGNRHTDTWWIIILSRLMNANVVKVKSGKYLAHFPVCEIFPRYFVMSEFNLTPKCHESRIYIEF